MAKQITEEAVKHINDNPGLYVELKDMLTPKGKKMSMASFATYLSRKRNLFTQYDLLKKIAEDMGVEPETLLEEKAEAATA